MSRAITLDHGADSSRFELEARGIRYWARSYWLMVKWEALSLRMLLPIMVVVQFFVGAGSIVGLGFFFDEVPPLQALYISTGSSVVALLMLGFVMAPQTISQRKMEGTYEFIWTLPVPRVTTVAAGMTVWMVVAIPGMIAALAIAMLRYDIDLQVSWLIVPAVLLTVAMSTSLGNAFAHGIPNPLLVNLLTQILIFVIIMYSPINFPASRFPDWLNALHSVLPLEHAANVVRAGLTDGIVNDVGKSFAILAGWTAASIALTAWILGRRR
jgi:ABC-2 type transport system permease protein